MKNSPLYTWVVEITAALFILLFVYTGITKLIEQSSFRGVISRSQLIGRWSTYYLEFNTIFTFPSALDTWFNIKHQRFIAIDRNSRTPVKKSRQQLLN